MRKENKCSSKKKTFKDSFAVKSVKGIVFNDVFSQCVFIIPALFVFTVFTVYPALTSLYYSFTDWTGIGTNYNFVGFDNYLAMFQRKDLAMTLPVTIYYATLNAFSLLFFAFFIALMLNRSSKVTNFVRICFFIPMLISPMIVGFVFKEIYAPVVGTEMGTLNRILTEIGLGALAHNWLGNEYTVMLVVVFTGIWNHVGQTALIYLANMQTIPKELYESARIDGAGYWKTTYYITWKLMGPSLMINAILSLINSMKAYDMISLLTNGGPGTATKVINLSIVELTIGAQKVGMGCAMSMVVTAFTFITVTVIQKLLSKKVSQN